MEKIDVIWKIFSMYILIIFFILLGNTAFAQIEVIHFNAEWNSANGVPWVMDLEDCKTIGLTDITKNPDIAKKHKIAVVPTIIIFKEGEEVARFQADLSFKMVATREEVQEEINNQTMSDF